MFKGLSNLANLGAIFKQAQEMGARMQSLQNELKSRRVTGSAGAGLVTVEVNGVGEVLSCRIDESLDDREMLEDLLPSAVNDALAKSKELHAEAMRDITAELQLPGLDGMLAQFTGGGIPDSGIPHPSGGAAP